VLGWQERVVWPACVVDSRRCALVWRAFVVVWGHGGLAAGLLMAHGCNQLIAGIAHFGVHDLAISGRQLAR
jgi:hypothetical protein